jgi:multidrug efflux pump subunit AcrB
MVKRFITFIVENTHFTALLMLIIMVYGFTSLSRVNVSQDPDIDYPMFALKLFLPGATPARMEQDVVFPVEQELRSINGITTARTHIAPGVSVIEVRFQHRFDITQKMQETETAINQIKRKLPSELEFTLENMLTSGLLSAFVVSFHAPFLTPQEQEDSARDLVAMLQQVDNLKDIELLRPDKEIVVELDSNQLYRHNITPEQVLTEIKAYNTTSVGGVYPLGNDVLSFVGPDKRYQRPQDINSTVLYSDDGKALELGELALVYLRNEADHGTITRFNGRPAGLIKIGVESKQSNIIEVKKNLQAKIEEFKAGFKEAPEIEMVFDQAREVDELLSVLVKSFIQGIVILFLVLLFAVGIRSTVIITTLLPLSFLMAIMLLSFTGFGIQQVSLAGFIIALGLMVDNAIVVTENAYLLQRYQNHDRKQAAIIGTSAAVSPLISSALTTMLAFAPVFMLTADTALYLRSLSVSIWLSLIASLFIAVTFITLLLSRMGTLGTLFNLPVMPSFLNALIPFRDSTYKNLLRLLVKWRGTTILIFVLVLGSVLSLAGSLKVEIFPVTGNPYFTINIQLPKNYREDKRNELMDYVEKVLSEFEDVTSFSSASGQTYPWLNVGMDPTGDIVFLVETKYGEERRLKELTGQIEERLNPLAMDANINLSLFKYKDPVYRSPFTVIISGNDTQQLQEHARKIHEPLKMIEGIKNIDNPAKSSQPGFRLTYRYDKAELLGISKSQVDAYILMLTYGFEIDRYRDRRGNEYAILLKLGSDKQQIDDVLRDTLITSAEGKMVPLSEVVELSLYESETKRQHSDFKPILEMDVWLEPGFEAGEAAARAQQVLAQIDSDAGISVEIGGALAKKQEDFQGFGKNALIIAALIFSIFVLQFRSFSQPLIVFTAVPFCLIGVIAALFLTSLPVTFFAAVGITSLMGIVVNDSILLVDEANKQRQEMPELSIAEVAIEAARKRFMPIILTSVTTIAGLLPLAIEESPFRVMAVCIIGGLTSSTVLLLFLVPTLYSLLSANSAQKATKS